MRIFVLAWASAGAPIVPSPSAAPVPCRKARRLIVMSISLFIVSSHFGQALTRLLGVFLHHEIAHVRAQLAELGTLVQGAGARIGKRHLDDFADSRRSRRHYNDA